MSMKNVTEQSTERRVESEEEVGVEHGLVVAVSEMLTLVW